MIRVLFFIGFGLLPLWIAIIAVAKGAAGRGAEYASAAPWLIVIAIFICGITWSMARATLYVFDRSEGTLARKLGIAIAALLSMFALICVAVLFYKWHYI